MSAFNVENNTAGTVIDPVKFNGVVSKLREFFNDNWTGYNQKGLVEETT